MIRFRGRGNSRGGGRGIGRGYGRPRFFNKGNKKPAVKKFTSGPAECNIPELAEHYFDCISFNEANRFINTKEKIIQYLGTNYGGDVRATLEKMEIYQIPVPEDPVKKRKHTDDIVKDKR